jgi:signal transduction histidine kinase
LSVGRDQSLSLQRLAQSHPSLSKDRNFELLQKTAAKLQSTGNMLLSLSRADALDEKNWRQIPEVPLNAFIKSVWADINNNEAAVDTLSIDGDCQVRAAPEDLSIMISSILQWLARRFIDTPFGIEPRISVHCGHYDKGVEAIFEDRSHRLGKVLRDRLFDPFAENDGLDDAGKSNLSLYEARLLIEDRYNGVLEDISDLVDAAADSGHRFRMRFPSPFKTKTDLNW